MSEEIQKTIAGSPAASSRNRQFRATALLVDDDPDTRASYLKWLQDEGYQVTSVSDATAGLAMAEKFRSGNIFVHLGKGHIPVTVLSRYFSRSLESQGLTAIPHENF
ncbi:MAG: response regulator [Chloroflexi bacterium]|nr:MAG: response regulator [Chloroflexota bacterium]